MTGHHEWLRHEAAMQFDTDPDKAAMLNTAAARLAELETITAEIPERVLRCYKAASDVFTPDGWETRFHDFPLGLAVTREDGWKAFIMPSTDGTPRWYVDGALVGEEWGSVMEPDAQSAVDFTIEHAPKRHCEDRQ